MARGGQPGDLRAVGLTAGLTLMRETREQGVVAPMVLENLEVLGQLVVGAGLGGEECRRVQSQRVADDHHPLGRGGSGFRQRRAHHLQQRKGQCHSGGPQKGAPIEVGREWVGHGYFSLKRLLCVIW